MELHAGYCDASRVVHLTSHTFLLESLCGETVSFAGEPAYAVICEDCHALGIEAGGDPESWVVVEREAVTLLAAA